jgi:very-short-patch-repair endonuclease
MPGRVRGHRSRISAEKKAFARQLRRTPTRAYQLLWSGLRKKKLGVRFLRRRPIFGWIPDFWCPSKRIVVEIDYLSDDQRRTDHRRRDRVLAERGIVVLRFSAERVYADADQVAREIALVCQHAEA